MKKSAAAALSLSIVAITIGLVISSFMLSRFMLKIQHSTEKSIKVKGVAEKQITSDLAAFTCSVSVKAKTLSDGYVLLDKTSVKLCDKLNKLGFSENMREDQDISYCEVYKNITTKSQGKETTIREFDCYQLTYSLRVRTTDVALVSKNVLKIYELASEKIDVSVGTPQYFISNPEQYKLELVNAASASAAERARTAARQSGSTLGPLMVARQGVIQITSPASTETSDYGVYNTSSVEKVIRLVMTMEFALK